MLVGLVQQLPLLNIYFIEEHKNTNWSFTSTRSIRSNLHWQGRLEITNWIKQPDLDFLYASLERFENMNIKYHDYNTTKGRILVFYVNIKCQPKGELFFKFSIIFICKNPPKAKFWQFSSLWWVMGGWGGGGQVFYLINSWVSECSTVSPNTTSQYLLHLLSLYTLYCNHTRWAVKQ